MPPSVATLPSMSGPVETAELASTPPPLERNERAVAFENPPPPPEELWAEFSFIPLSYLDMDIVVACVFGY